MTPRTTDPKSRRVAAAAPSAAAVASILVMAAAAGVATTLPGPASGFAFTTSAPRILARIQQRRQVLTPPPSAQQGPPPVVASTTPSQQQRHRRRTRDIASDDAASSSTTTTTRLDAFAGVGAEGTSLLTGLDAFFQTQPYLAAFVTCSVKASAADWVAQLTSENQQKSLQRNLAFVAYGGLYQGMVQTFLYSVLFPAVFGPDPTAATVLGQVAVDLLVLGPLVCMPTVYTMKALFAGELEGPGNRFKGIEKYLDHVRSKGILQKYWSIWAPVQTLNFSVVPTHMRVLFVAAVSFFWICLLSTVSSSTSSTEEEEGTVLVQQQQAQLLLQQQQPQQRTDHPSPFDGILPRPRPAGTGEPSFVTTAPTSRQ